MKKLKRIGFFKELSYGDPEAASIVESKNKLDRNLVENIVTYLDSGVLFTASTGLSRDFFDNKVTIGTLGVLTDGHWAWSTDLSYYVRKFKVALPADFLEYMENNKWNHGDVTIEELEF